MKRFPLFFVLIGLLTMGALSCVNLQTVRPAAEEAERVANQEKEALDKARGALEKNDYEQALALYRDFQKDYPRSSYRLSARLSEGEALEGLDEWTEALAIYKSTYEIAVKDLPAISSLAQYRMSFCYEALGDDVKAVAALVDSLRNQKSLPVEVARAEIPARLSMLYGKQQNVEEAARYANLAQQGISELQGRANVPPATLAKAYYQMGAVSMNQISPDNFSEVVRAQKSVQIYLLKAIGMKIDPWSREAAEKLKKNYRDMWNTLFASPAGEAPKSTSGPGLDREAADRLRREQQILQGAEFLDLLQTAEYYKPLDDKKMNKVEADFFNYLTEIQNRVGESLYRNDATMPLTNESQRLNGLTRPGRIQVNSPENRLPVKKMKKAPALPAKVLGPDPNL